MTKVDVSLVFQYHRFCCKRHYTSDSSIVGFLRVSVCLSARVATVFLALIAIGSSLTSVACGDVAAVTLAAIATSMGLGVTIAAIVSRVGCGTVLLGVIVLAAVLATVGVCMAVLRLFTIAMMLRLVLNSIVRMLLGLMSVALRLGLIAIASMLLMLGNMATLRLSKSLVAATLGLCDSTMSTSSVLPGRA